MSLQDRLKPFIKILKIASICGSSCLFIAYHINQTYKTIDKIVNPNVLEREKKYTAEYVYIDDPAYGIELKMEQDRQSKQAVGFARIWKSLKHSLAWRLLWLCRHGNREQRNVALEQLAAFKNNKSWDCLKLAQALDPCTAVLLARTRGADLRYFLPPPIHVRRAAGTSELLSFKFRDMITAVQAINHHSCIEHFLSKYFTNVQEPAMEADSIPTKPDSISERNLCILCLDALHHHITLFCKKNYDDDISTALLVNLGLLQRLSEFLLRYKNDADIDLAVLRVLTVLSVHCNLLKDFFQNGLIGELSRLVRCKDVRLSSSAAVCLANLSGEYCYRPGLYLLHPLYRTTTPQVCDTLLVHGLRGGVFVTWRQRDKKCQEPIGILEVTVSDVDCDPCQETQTEETKYIDPEIQQVLKDLLEIKEESFLADYEVVLHDIPIEAKREPLNTPYTTNKKRIALLQEEEDHCNHTLCWPKDWLPNDCSNLRILGVNYWSSLSDWLERCPLQTADIASRAADLAPVLVDAGVGRKNVPVVWLAHSMGGLIVKQVLTEASESSDSMLKKLSENTKAIVFYSTPHKGSSLAAMPRAAAAVLWPSNDVRQLQENSPTLLKLHTAFLKFADLYDWETISFAETMPTLITAFKVPVHFVESFSADLGRGVFYQLPLDHLSICKPATRQSILYTTVLDTIHRATMKDVQLKYSNPYLQWILDWFWWAVRTRAKETMDDIDDNQGSEGLRWFEQILLDAFTDGFTN
ncbi:Protein SERAC1 [Operophtera brumata]|uniref:Protein SERAC1 n=1 Tax=Operophtera brumata TaxID=104452 RepID=A0A0L7L078_OPEBR|nr:Protein SERAC1 [Operophtera brumata]